MAWSKLLKKSIQAILPPAFWLGAWQLAAWLVERSVQGRGNELLLPYPVTVLRSLAGLAALPEFWQATAVSLGRVLLGLGLGVALGAVLAVLTGASRWCDLLLSPAVRCVRATPVTSFILLILLWIGRDFVPAVIAALMVLPVVWENLSGGVRAVDPLLLEMASAYRFSRWKKARLIYLPSLRPYFSAALTTGMGLAWKSGVAAEVICLPRWAMGKEIYNSKIYLEIPDLFAWTVVVIALSLALEKLLRRVLRKGGAK